MKTCRFVLVAGALMGLFVVSQALAQGLNPSRPPFFAVLLGGNEVSDEGQANAGDPNGVGSATILIDDTTLCFGITVNNLTSRPRPTSIGDTRGSMAPSLCPSLHRRVATLGRRVIVSPRLTLSS